MATASIAPVGRALTLYELEENLASLLDCVESVEPEQEEEFLAAVREAMTATKEKRNRVYQFLRHCKSLQESCAEEIRRLQNRKEVAKNAEERMRDRIRWIIEGLGVDSKGKYKKLECDYATFSLRSTPSSLRIEDESKVPDKFRRITVSLPLDVWRDVKQFVCGGDGPSAPLSEWAQHLHLAEESATIRVDEAGVKSAIAALEDVPGADLLIGGLTLQVK